MRKNPQQQIGSHHGIRFLTLNRICLQRVFKLGKASILPVAKLRKNGLSNGKGAIEQTSQESHKARISVSGAESEQYSTYGARCAPKRHGRLAASSVRDDSPYHTTAALCQRKQRCQKPRLPSNSLRTDATRAPVLFHHEHQLPTKKFNKICACRCNSSQINNENALHSYAMEQSQILSGCFNCGVVATKDYYITYMMHSSRRSRSTRFLSQAGSCRMRSRRCARAIFFFKTFLYIVVVVVVVHLLPIDLSCRNS
jgi:hypothetical protein